MSATPSASNPLMVKTSFANPLTENKLTKSANLSVQFIARPSAKCNPPNCTECKNHSKPNTDDFTDRTFVEMHQKL